jgi:hypothetical protein
MHIYQIVAFGFLLISFLIKKTLINYKFNTKNNLHNKNDDKIEPLMHDIITSLDDRILKKQYF